MTIGSGNHDVDDTAHGPVHPVAASFAAWMAGSAAGGAEALQRAELLPAADLPSQIAAIMRLFGRHNDDVTDLDALLRSDPTAVLDLDHPLLRGEVRRLHVLQRELQRACLTATLGRIPPQRRAASAGPLSCPSPGLRATRAGPRRRA